MTCQRLRLLIMIDNGIQTMNNRYNLSKIKIVNYEGDLYE